MMKETNHLSSNSQFVAKQNQKQKIMVKLIKSLPNKLIIFIN